MSTLPPFPLRTPRFVILFTLIRGAVDFRAVNFRALVFRALVFRAVVFCALFFCALVVSAPIFKVCTAHAADDDAHAKPVIGVTLGAQAMIVEQLTLGSAAVEVLLPPGANHETYEPSFRQLSALSKVKLFLSIGHPNFDFEKAWLPRVQSMAPKMKLVASTIPSQQRSDDIHIWLSIHGMRSMVRVTETELKALLPEQATAIHERADQLEKRIDELSEELKQATTQIPSKYFLSIHPSWTYLAAELGLEQIALESHGKEVGIRGASQVLAGAKSHKVSAIFVEPGSAPQQVAFVAAAVGAKTVTLDPIAKDWFSLLRSFAGSLSVGGLRGVEGRQP